MQQYNTPTFNYKDCGITMVIPFHPRVLSLVDKIPENTWSAIFTVALYNLAHEDKDKIDQREFIYESIVHGEFGYDNRNVSGDIAQYISNVQDILLAGYRAQVDEYTALILNIDKVRESTNSGEWSIRKIIHYWLRTELSHVVGKSRHHHEFKEVRGLFSEHGVLFPAIWMETFGLYDEPTINKQTFDIDPPHHDSGSDTSFDSGASSDGCD